MPPLPLGKLPASLLQQLLERYAVLDRRVLVGPGIGRDAAILELGDRCLVATTDPVTYVTDESGWYAVHINANDVACCGATPRWFLVAVLLPETATSQLTETIFREIHSACRQLDVAWCGGHTEVVPGLPRAILVGQMLGEVARGEYLTAAGARVGDVVILTKAIALEGTAILARERSDQLRGLLGEAGLRFCAGLLHEPGISVLRDARLAIEAGGVHALHDPTEGGVATGLWELAQAAGVGLVIDQPRLPLLRECEAVCAYLGLDPLGLIASGSLLIAAHKERSATILQRLHAERIAATVIGEVVPVEQGCCLRRDDSSLCPLPTFASDEITRLFLRDEGRASPA